MTKAKAMQVEPELLTTRQAAEFLGVSIAWVRLRVKDKEPHLPFVRLGRLMKFRREDLQEYIIKCRQTE